jgi:hypothetical protein
MHLKPPVNSPGSLALMSMEQHKLLSYEALCDLPIVTEEEFLKREFQISIKYIESNFDFDNYSKNNRLIIVVTNNPTNWADKLNSSKDCVYVIFLIGNETYEPDIYNSLNSINNLLHAFIYNTPTNFRPKNIIGSVLGYIYDGGLKNTKAPGNIYRDARISFSLKDKFKKFQPNFSYSELPQGYSNNFIFNLQSLTGISPGVSMINQSSLNYVNQYISKKKSMSFIGQSTNRRREVFLRVAQQYVLEKFVMNSNFQGTKPTVNTTYVEQLLDNKFVLVPPGFYNNSNHRYTESLICGAIPLILAFNSLDPSSNENWTEDLPFLARFSIKKQIELLLKMPEPERLNLLDSIRLRDFQRIKVAREKFQSLMRT